MGPCTSQAVETKETLQPRDSLASQIGTSDYNILLLGIEFHIQRTEQISIYARVFCCFQFTVSKNIEHRTGSVVSGHFMLFMGKLCLHMCAYVCVCEQPRYMRCLGRDAEHTHVRRRIKNANLLSIYINLKFCLSTPRHKKYLYLYLYICMCMWCIYIYLCVLLCKCWLRKTKMNVQIERISSGSIYCYCPMRHA